MRPGPSSFARPDCTNQDPSQCPRGTNQGRTYRFYAGKLVVPFGFGLSYSSFSYAVASQPSAVSLAHLQELVVRIATLQETASRWQSSVQYSANMTNTGSRDADDVVLGLLTPPGACQNGVPLKLLFGFERVRVKAGETVTAWLYRP
ncbi:unnamed protein product [Polarella glacialis]|uniref:Beta-glucosidase n=1 Tax=Polarella glacialis TaxID=89957 RepID=A0A813H8G1_POLGL|nr:unnamed protein product [Polarella glacialis]